MTINSLRTLASVSLVTVGVNLGMYGAARLAGGFGTGVRTANGQEIGAAAVMAATAVGIAGAMLVRAVLRRVIRDRRLARRVFLGVSVGVLLLSLATPVLGVRGGGWIELAALELMHIAAAVGAMIAAEYAARPRWEYGVAPYRERVVSPRVALVSGATSGIGAEVALELAGRGFRVLAIGRSQAKASGVAERAAGMPGTLRFILGDMSRRSEVSRLASEVGKAAGPEGVGLVVHCAGVLKPRSRANEDGVDENFAGSFLGRYQLTGAVRLAEGCRVVNVAAAESGRIPSWMPSLPERPEEIGHGMRSQGVAQLANDIWVGLLIARGVSAIAYGPGAVETAIRREIPWIVRVVVGPIFLPELRSARDAGLDVVRLALDASAASSGYASRDGFFEPAGVMTDPLMHARLVKLCEAAAAATVADEP